MFENAPFHFLCFCSPVLVAELLFMLASPGSLYNVYLSGLEGFGFRVLGLGLYRCLAFEDSPTEVNFRRGSNHM